MFTTTTISQTEPAAEVDKPLPFHLTDLDRQTLNMADEDFIPDSWEDLKNIIGANKLDMFRRYPSHLRNYISWTHKTKQDWNGDMSAYLCANRLRWTRLPQGGFAFRNAVPMADPRDFKILLNDWPYAFAKEVEHMVVWSKTPIAVKPDNGEVTEESAKLIQQFVDSVFVEDLSMYLGDHDKARENVMWFKNWTKLQSMRAVEHFHVLVNGAPEELLQKWTNGDKRDMARLRGQI